MKSSLQRGWIHGHSRVRFRWRQHMRRLLMSLRGCYGMIVWDCGRRHEGNGWLLVGKVHFSQIGQGLLMREVIVGATHRRVLHIQWEGLLGYHTFEVLSLVRYITLQLSQTVQGRCVLLGKGSVLASATLLRWKTLHGQSSRRRFLAFDAPLGQGVYVITRSVIGSDIRTETHPAFALHNVLSGLRKSAAYLMKTIEGFHGSWLFVGVWSMLLFPHFFIDNIELLGVSLPILKLESLAGACCISAHLILL